MKNDKSKSTLLVITVGFLLLSIVFDWHWALYVSLIVGVVGIISAYLSRKIEWLWMKLSVLLGYIIPNLLLSIVFYLILLPISLLLKLLGKDPLMLSNRYSSYFRDVKSGIDKTDFKKTW